MKRIVIEVQDENIDEIKHLQEVGKITVMHLEATSPEEQVTIQPFLWDNMRSHVYNGTSRWTAYERGRDIIDGSLKKPAADFIGKVAKETGAIWIEQIKQMWNEE